jgi:putative flippase GtrA
MSTQKEICRFLLVTPFVGLTDFGVYFLCLEFLPLSVSKGIAFAVAAVVGYLLNKHWTFRKHRRSYSEAGRYFLIQVFLLGFNVVVNKLVLLPFPEAIFLAMMTASLLTAVVSFILKKWWVFSGRFKFTRIAHG